MNLSATMITLLFIIRLPSLDRLQHQHDRRTATLKLEVIIANLVQNKRLCHEFRLWSPPAPLIHLIQSRVILAESKIFLDAAAERVMHYAPELSTMSYTFRMRTFLGPYAGVRSRIRMMIGEERFQSAYP
jgi:hypothetical protein